MYMYVSLMRTLSRQNLSAKHTSAYVSIHQHTSAHVSTRQHTSAYVPMRPQYSESAALSTTTGARQLEKRRHEACQLLTIDSA
jgi:hypothetical protein